KNSSNDTVFKCTSILSLSSWSPSYNGPNPVSNMVIIDVKMLSGFIPVKPSVKKRPEKALEKDSLSSYHTRAPSAEVEMTAYVLLAYLSKRPAPAQEEMTAGANIVRWLSKQQNPTGGFASTQDTVVALQALSLYGSLSYSKSKAGAKVTLSSGEDVLGQYLVDSTNRLLLQCETLPKVPGDYKAEVTGEGCTYVQGGVVDEVTLSAYITIALLEVPLPV
ncbi:hypothetical protein JD844_010046, partial [Phrynosoma platyrhinos]